MIITQFDSETAFYLIEADKYNQKEAIDMTASLTEHV